MVYIDVLYGRKVMLYEYIPACFVLQMLTKSLQRVRLPVGIIVLSGEHITTYQIVKLLLIDFFLRPIGNDSTCSDVVKVRQELSNIRLNLSIWVDILQCIDGRLLQTNVEIIDRSDYIKLRTGIDHTPFHAL